MCQRTSSHKQLSMRLSQWLPGIYGCLAWCHSSTGSVSGFIFVSYNLYYVKWHTRLTSLSNSKEKKILLLATQRANHLDIIYSYENLLVSVVIAPTSLFRDVDIAIYIKREYSKRKTALLLFFIVAIPKY